MKLFLKSWEEVFGYIIGSKPWRPLFIVESSDGKPWRNPAYHIWIKQDQLIWAHWLIHLLMMWCLLSLIVLWMTLEKYIASPSNTRITTLHMALQELHHELRVCLILPNGAKSYNDELVVVSRPLGLTNFNLYVFKGLRCDLKDLAIILTARLEYCWAMNSFIRTQQRPHCCPPLRGRLLQVPTWANDNNSCRLKGAAATSAEIVAKAAKKAAETPRLRQLLYPKKS